MKQLKKLSLQQTLWQLFVSGCALLVAIGLVESVSITNNLSAFIAVLLAQVVQFVMRPFFDLLTKVFGIIGILLISFFANGLILWATFVLLPSITVASFWGGFVVAWTYAFIMTVLNWAFLSQSDEVFLTQITRNMTTNPKNNDQTGFIFVQLDGVSAPVLDWQLKAGNLPHISKLLREQNYKFRTWHTQIPSTTPASQAGILFGNNDNIPAFRWYEKETGQLVVANQSKGAQLIERRLSSGHGLLADAGVSVGNLFSGDAKTNIMVMSKLDGDRESLKTMREYSSYFYTPLGFMRSFVLSIGEMIKELYQAKRQVRLDIRPRIHRHGSYVLLRAMTNVMLRDLQTTIVVQNMLQGVNSLYVDYLDYDEVAHHAGPARAESLASLSGLDRVIGILHRAKVYAPRPYELIIVSDHGQSQGTTFKQLHSGKTLEDFVKEFMGDNLSVASSTAPIENNSVTTNFFSQQAAGRSIQKSAAHHVLNRSEKQQENIPQKVDIVVTGSGNLGNIWINTYNKQAYYEDIQKDYPHLITNLLQTPGIGFVFVTSKDGPLCLNAHGSINLATQEIVNRNPLAAYSPHLRQALLRLRSMKSGPDICVISTFDTTTGEVHAFEELVGNHGGIGGWQTEAIFLYPGHLQIPKQFEQDGELHDSVTIHKILKHWLKQAGHN